MLATLLRRLLPRRLGYGPTRFAEVHALYARGALARAERAAAAIGDAARPDIEFLQGLIARKRGDRSAAAARMSSAVDARPEEPAFRIALAEVLLESKRYDVALTHFEAFLATAAASGAARISALRHAAKCAIERGENSRAWRHVEEALALAPDDFELRNLASTALLLESRAEEARTILEPLVAAGVHGMKLRRALFLPPVYESREHIEDVRERLSRELDSVIDSPGAPVDEPMLQIGLTPFHLAYHDSNNAALLEKLCRANRALYTPPAARRRRRRRGGPLRIGFVSTFFRLHSVGRVTLGLIRDLPRERYSVHVFAIASGDDAMRAAIEAAADDYRALPAVLDEARRAIEEAELDVLVFADIGMHGLTYFLALSRLAPVQAVWWGHPETTGIDTIDYFMSADAVEIEGAQSHYTERLARPAAFFLPGYERAKLEQPMERDALGLPANARIYACLQPLFKLHPDIDGVFSAILERDAEGEVLLLEGTAAATDLVRRRIARRCGGNAGRVRFIPQMTQQKYLATLKAADVSLDPLYFGGGNSSCDSIAMGVPLVTLPGSHLYGRLTLGLYEEMAMAQCVASSADDYANLACRIAGTPDMRQAIRRDYAEREHVLYGRTDITLAYADFFEHAVAARG